MIISTVLLTLHFLSLLSGTISVKQNALVTVESIDEETGKKTSKNSIHESDRINYNDKFIPTREWQEIKPNQAVPSGLHYRMNLETGKKEAKLLDRNSNEEENGDTKGNEIDRNILLMTEMKRAMKNMEKAENAKQKPIKNNEEIKKKFRTYEQLKEEMLNLNMDMKNDMEIMQAFLEEYLQPKTTFVRKAEILLEFEYLLHQFDNAVNFASSGFKGIDIVKEAINATDSVLRSAAALVIGSASQNNPKVKVAFYDNGILHSLISLMAVEKDLSVKQKFVYALSTIIIGFPFAQKKFIELGGFVHLSEILASNLDFKLTLKVVRLITILISEKLDFIHHENIAQIGVEKYRQYENLNSLETLQSNSICQWTTNILLDEQFVSDEENLDGQEKVLKLLQNLHKLEACSWKEAKKWKKPVGILRKIFEDASINDPNDEYYKSLIEICDSLLIYVTKDEL